MKPEEFNKGIKEFQAFSLSNIEKSRMLEAVLQTPVESPFDWGEVSTFFRKPIMAGYVLASFTLTLTSFAYTAEKSLPGETLYSIKTALFEPIQDQFHLSPAEKLEWEAEKIDRRIAEAEELSKNNQLDERKTEELEKKIKKSSSAYAVAAEKVASSTATTTEGRNQKTQALKESIRKKLEDKKQAETKKEEKQEEKEKIKRLKDRAVKALDERDEGKDEEEKSGRGNREERD
jgi:hypothetical protein